jgi:hypothetical protein
MVNYRQSAFHQRRRNSMQWPVLPGFHVLRGDSASLSLENSNMPKTRKPQATSARLTARALLLANGAMRAFDALAADLALAQRATAVAALQRQRLTELRALYTDEA